MCFSRQQNPGAAVAAGDGDGDGAEAGSEAGTRRQ